MHTLTIAPQHSFAAPSRKATRILALVLSYANEFGGSADTNAYELHRKKIEQAIERNETLELVLPAFPAKSPNREKTLGALPDFAEVLGLERLQEICNAIGTIHAPGARVLICSDGRVFSDLVLVSDEEVGAYGGGIREIIRELGLSNLATFSLEDVFGNTDFDLIRARLVEEFGRPVTEIRASSLSTREGLMMFNGIHRFLFEDRLALEPAKSRNRVREESKEIAYQVIQRSNAWSSLVEKLFPKAVRLSIHPQFAPSAKIGFQLVSCENAWGTPWHNVALLTAEGFRLVKRKDAECQGATLALARGKYAFYKENSV
ncbi:MAG: L-tyrosine/L-tryptophan isonitrile synthase family protein [Bdellovibrionota bacterium]